MKLSQYFAFLNIHVLELGDQIIFSLLLVTIPPFLMLMGVYWIVREFSKKGAVIRGVHILGVLALISGILLLMLARNYDTNQLALLLVGPVALAAGTAHWIIRKSITNSGIVMTGVGVAVILILAVHAISNL
jgi:hypothetical protein